MRPLVRFEVGAALPRELDWLSPSERARLAAMRFPRRRHDFRRGRWTAKRALLCALGETPHEPLAALAEIDICADDRGAPHALQRGRALPCDLSLSHRAGAALCVIGGRGTRVGCDVEWIEARSPAFERCFLAESERRWLDAQPGATRARAANLLWSAKESALKALHIGLDVDTRSVLVRFSSVEDRGFRVSVPGFETPLYGRWRTRGRWIWTLASPEPDALSQLDEAA
jgi:4'-phosphopantetheinyl transferase